MTDAAAPPTRAGFIAVLGAPNAGKSTLVNRLVGAKVTIVSAKVQTTRSRVLGIVQHPPAQLIFVDTPGLFQPRRRLDRAMVAAAWSGAADADLVLLLIDAKRGYDEDSRAIVARLKDSGRRALLALNKIDKVADKKRLLDLAALLDGEGVFDAIYMISAETGDGCPQLLDDLAQRLPAGPFLFPEDQISDLPERLLASEITREQLYHQLHQELPYTTTVETEAWTEQKDGSVRIEQIIYVERDSQKSIVLGAKGARIKALGQAARAELETLLDRRVHLFLFVKVRADWQDDRERYRAIGLDFDQGS